LQIVFRIFGTRPYLELLGLLGPLSQWRLVLLEHVVMLAGSFDHGLALSVEVKNETDL
jgi:hypothetical protein